MNEAALQFLIISYAKLRGLMVYHCFDSRRSQPGFPDLVIIGANGVIYRELKSMRGRLSSDQAFFLDALEAAGCDVGVWRPSDWPKNVKDTLDQLGAVQVQRPLPSQAEVRRQLQRRRTRGI